MPLRYVQGSVAGTVRLRRYAAGLRRDRDAEPPVHGGDPGRRHRPADRGGHQAVALRTPPLPAHRRPGRRRGDGAVAEGAPACVRAGAAVGGRSRAPAVTDRSREPAVDRRRGRTQNVSRPRPGDVLVLRPAPRLPALRRGTRRRTRAGPEGARRVLRRLPARGPPGTRRLARPGLTHGPCDVHRPPGPRTGPGGRRAMTHTRLTAAGFRTPPGYLVRYAL
ncbi:hypothetical protein SCOCK_10247 [Actinacidiphila cocklensis]|uniref:Uncharacterized protein n=1 Tax=Actinacidiphila cocklensis TaxID=887465 RepID=A0A9W4DG88_9ACTN|nr:hypothetical protein SCOCK_10247 [Actinacidiphila cocklensis]